MEKVDSWFMKQSSPGYERWLYPSALPYREIYGIDEYEELFLKSITLDLFDDVSCSDRATVLDRSEWKEDDVCVWSGGSDWSQ